MGELEDRRHHQWNNLSGGARHPDLPTNTKTNTNTNTPSVANFWILCWSWWMSEIASASLPCLRIWYSASLSSIGWEIAGIKYWCRAVSQIQVGGRRTGKGDGCRPVNQPKATSGYGPKSYMCVAKQNCVKNVLWLAAKAALYLTQLEISKPIQSTYNLCCDIHLRRRFFKSRLAEAPWWWKGMEAMPF